MVWKSRQIWNIFLSASTTQIQIDGSLTEAFECFTPNIYWPIHESRIYTCVHPVTRLTNGRANIGDNVNKQDQITVY